MFIEISSFRVYHGIFTGNICGHWLFYWHENQSPKVFSVPCLPTSTYDCICHFLLVRSLYPYSRWSGRNHREKIGVHVVFDQVLTMEPYCCRDMLSSLDKETFAYDLSAVVMHHGKGFGSGHYTAYCYNTEGGACALLCGVGDTEKGWLSTFHCFPFISSIKRYYIH